MTTAALALTMTLGACGRDEGGGGAEGQGEAISEGEASGTIEVWAMGTEGDVLGDFVSDFSDANPDADVKVTAIPWEAAHDKIANAIASGETPIHEVLPTELIVRQSTTRITQLGTTPPAGGTTR